MQHATKDYVVLKGMPRMLLQWKAMLPASTPGPNGEMVNQMKGIIHQPIMDNNG